MARPLRIEYPGAIYHVTARGNRRSQIFTDDYDRREFLKILSEVNRRFDTRCHAYCLMDNHYHLLLETPQANLSMVMRQLDGVYTQKYNWLHRKTGHVFQGRYKAIVIERDAYLLEVARYIVLNPVRAGLVGGPDKWPWSSYGATAGSEKADVSLTTAWLLGLFDNATTAAKIKYMEFVRNAPDINFADEVISGVVLGSGEFAEWCRAQARGGGDILEIPREQRFAGRPGLASIMASSGKKVDKVLEAVRTYGYTQKAVADELGVHYSAISKLLSRQMSRFKT